MINSSSASPSTTIQPNPGNSLVDTKDFDDQDTKDNAENKDSDNSPYTTLKESSTHSDSKKFSTHSDFILLKNTVNSQVGLNKTFKKWFNFLNEDINMLTEEKFCS